ncbi:hypothetical protein HPP92_004558 [Vanilla planifolia]|uniref:AP2/ERF domain-containing protein n=1 Tax=Vanilla planifolia TaxID=51239 RepID=A0A835VI83_VANPL|nr:hypothetical protein HPP92_004558 [Vanilla planifolia]
MNNWLGFSLASHDLQTAEDAASHGLRGDDGSFSILDAFNRYPHDWSMMSLDFKGEPSELSMLVDSGVNRADELEPKLEDFLGGQSFSLHDQRMAPTGGEFIFPDSSLPVPPVALSGGSGGGSTGLSVIKAWLRNQPHTTGSVSASSQSLSLSMTTGSRSEQSKSAALPAESSPSENREKALDVLAAVPRKSIETFGQRTSIYRGVTRHRWTGRYEAHLWDNSCRREGQSRKGRQVYLGGYDKEEKAARAYDLAALKYWGTSTTTNFPITNYEKELEEMKHMTRQEYVASLRRKSSGFSRGASIYRGVTRHHQHGRWQARIGRVAGNKDLYLGTFSTQEEAAEAYDIAAIKFRGLNAVTNFDMSRYDVKSILESGALPIGGTARRLKDVADRADSYDVRTTPAVAPRCKSEPEDGHEMLHLRNFFLGRQGNGPSSAVFGFGLPIASGCSGSGGGYGDEEVKSDVGYGNMLAFSDPYGGRNDVYYTTGVVGQGNGWTAAGGNGGDGAALFTAWNDAS